VSADDVQRALCGESGTRKRILFVQADFRVRGGGDAVATWMLQALREHHAVTVLTWKPVAWEALNRFYGTSLNEADFRIMTAPRLVRALIELDPDPDSIQKINYLYRWSKKIRQDYDLLVTADMMEADFGRQGIQYVHYPWMARQFSAYGRDKRGAGRDGLFSLLSGRITPWMWVSGYSFDRMKETTTLVNSDWTGRRYQEVYGVAPITVYPPVAGNFPDIPWEQREDGIICIGRLHPGKRFELILEVVAALRWDFPRLQLHIVGTQVDRADEREYYRRLWELVRANASWAHLHEDLSRDDLLRLAGRQRYGMHAQVDEHFGIAPAEMVRAGCITFVHRSGGQVEIVGNDPRLVYDTAEEAVARITTVLTDPQRQADLRRFVDQRKGFFSTRRFVGEFQEVVGRALAPAATSPVQPISCALAP
jgi:glycosyltransferase involved in cell wall biosynthesis